MDLLRLSNTMLVVLVIAVLGGSVAIGVLIGRRPTGPRRDRHDRKTPRRSCTSKR